MVGTLINNGMLFGSFNSPAFAGRGISPVGVPMLGPKMLGQLQAQDAAAHAPRLIDYGSSYALAAKASQIDGRDVNGISNPFAKFNVPIGDAAFKGEDVTMPAVSDVEFMADPDVLNVQPMSDPLDGARKMIDPAQQGQAEGMWMKEAGMAITVLGSLLLVAAFPICIAVMNGNSHQICNPQTGGQCIMVDTTDNPDNAVLAGISTFLLMISAGAALTLGGMSRTHARGDNSDD